MQLVSEAEIETTNAVDKAKSLYKAGLSDYLSILDAQRQQNRDKMQCLALHLCLWACPGLKLGRLATSLLTVSALIPGNHPGRPT
ncbi:hypothetical protein [Shewanella benthica]|uniref:Outer membrane efflux protein n=1 Tax=Shewanella benthica KT99 TaxID=314608 RepID=A9DG52_9GAMM|nr:hypothetical protein [Shewanella benthica]EDP99364.1 hypothetical protein KT99_14585 [Shewanella benthica KT99]